MATNETIAGTQVPSDEHNGPGNFPPFEPAHFASSLVWLAITFGFLYYLMSKVALPRMEGILSDRKAKIDSDLNAARAAKTKADEAAALHAKTLAQARANAQTLAQQTRDKLAAETDARRATLEGELKRQLSEAEAQIAQAKAQAMGNVAGIAHDSAAAIVAHLTGLTADSEAVRAAIAQG